MPGQMMLGRRGLVGPLLLHKGQAHAHELARDARQGDVMMLLVLAFLLGVVVAEVRVVLAGGIRRLHEGPPEGGRPALGHVAVGGHGLAGLALRGVHPGVCHKLMRVVEAVGVADLARYRRGEHEPYAGHGEQPSAVGLVEQAGELPVDLVDLAADEVELLHEQPDLEGEGPRSEPDADRAPRCGLELLGLLAAALAPGGLPQDALERADVGREHLAGSGAVLEKGALRRPE